MKSNFIRRVTGKTPAELDHQHQRLPYGHFLIHNSACLINYLQTSSGCGDRDLCIKVWLYRGKLDVVPATEEFISIGLRLPVWTVVSKNGEAGDGAPVFVVETVVVGKEAFGEVTLLATLHFDVHVHPVFAAVVGGDLDEFVEEPLAEFGISDDLGEFLIKEGVAAVPVDLPMRSGN